MKDPVMFGDPSLIRSSERLAALHRLALLDTPAEPGFDRLTRLASRLLHAPVALVSLVDADRQFFKSSVGLAEPLASARETPLSHSFCQYAVTSGQPLIINDARTHPLVHDNPAISELGAVAYAGIPLILPDGSAIGTLCAIDNVPREWTEEEIATVHDLAASVITEIALRDDVAERKRSEAALHMAKRELEQRVAERTSELRAANRQLQIELHERTQAEAIARRLAEQRKFLLEVAQSMVSTPALNDILRQFQHALHEVLVYDSLGITEDITERVRNEQALRESEERFAKAFRASPVSITITALASGKFIDVNDSFLDLMGYSREEVIGHTSVELGVWANSDDRARVAQALRELRSIRSMEIPFRARSGAIIETLASMELIDLNGERCILALTQDITGHRRTEAALRESEERFRRLSEVSFEGIAIHDHGIILDANVTQAKMLGYEPGEIIGMNVMQFATPESREIILRNIRAGYEGPYEVVGVRKDGTTFPVEVQAKAFTYQGRRVRVAAIRDITKRKQAEQERERLIAELTEALASVKTLSGMLPICASCKKIRDDSGYWNQIESYIQAHSDAVFSHGICPDCMKRLYGDLGGE
jgi:PAS domain S-box-containing protein